MATNTYETVDLEYKCFTSNKHIASEKPPLLIFHGLFGNKEMWNDAAQAIRDKTNRTVITVDARNHGRSPYAAQHTYIHMAHDTAKLINKLGHPKVSVLGHSMGGRTAMALSLLHVELISSMIVVDISPRETSDTRKKVLMNSLNGFARIISDLKPHMTFCEATEEVIKQISLIRTDLSRNRVVEFVNNALVTNDSGAFAWRVNIPVLKKYFATITTFPAEMKGRQYSGPTLFIAGAESDYISKNDLSMLQEFFPAADLVFVENAGHSLPYDHPEIFNNIVGNFLEMF